METFLGLEEVKELVLVTTPENIKEFGAGLQRERVTLVEGGATRMESLRSGFNALSTEIDLVAVHDGARPLVTPEIARKTLEAADLHGAAVAAVKAKDTLKRVDLPEMWVSATPERSAFWHAQTPQCYRREILNQALADNPKEEDATDESQIVERMGQKVRIVESSYENLKITTPEDLVVAEAVMGVRQGGAKMTRTGFGYDIHRLVEGRPLWLAGMEVPHTKGLEGHSDGDVILHACCDAILGALGEGEIGVAFPPTDPQFKGIASRKIAEHVLGKMKGCGGELVHLDATIVAEEPKLKPHYAELKKSLAESFGVSASHVNLKAKSHEGLGEIGRGEALSCYAVASVSVSG